MIRLYKQHSVSDSCAHCTHVPRKLKRTLFKSLTRLLVGLLCLCSGQISLSAKENPSFFRTLCGELQQTLNHNRNNTVGTSFAALDGCDETILYVARDAGQILEFNLTTGTQTVVTTSPYTTSNLNALAANPDASVIYYGIGQKVHYWIPATGVHGTLVDLAGQIPAGESLSSGGGAYYNGWLYMGTENGNPGSYPKIYRLRLAFDGLSVNGSAVNLNVPIYYDTSWGDLIVSGESGYTVIYGGVGNQNAASSSSFFKYYLEIGTYEVINSNALENLQLAVDVDGVLWATGVGVDGLRRINKNTGAVYGAEVALAGNKWDLTGPINCAQSPEICANGIDDDNDGLVDCYDADCSSLVSAAFDLPKNIPSAETGTVSSFINISESGTITDLNILDLNITHSYINDLVITLESPEGTVVSLINAICAGENDIHVNLDDEAAASAFTCPPASGGYFQPAGSFSDFDGETVTGTWILRVQDTYPEDGGSINRWSLKMTTACNIEICGNGIDDNGNGQVDENCTDCYSVPTSGVLYVANFENQNGPNSWTLSDDGNAGDGEFLIGIPSPYSTGDGTIMELAAHGGSRVLATGLVSGEDLDGGPATAQSPDVCLPDGAECINMNFFWYYADATNGDAADYLNIQLRDKTNDVVLQTFVSENGNPSVRSAVWQEVSVDISAHAGKTVYLYIEAADFGNGSKTEVAVDDVRIGICREICDNGTDDDGDGLVDSEDSDCFSCPNRIDNSQFNAGKYPYELSNFQGNAADFSVDYSGQMTGEASARIDIASASGTDWHTQFYQKNLSIENGKRYRFGFSGKADAAKSVNVTAQGDYDPFPVFFSTDVDLTVNPQNFTFEFDALETVDNSVALRFNVGGNTVGLNLDDITWKEVCDEELCENVGTDEIYLEPDCGNLPSVFGSVADNTASQGNYVVYNGTDNYNAPASAAAEHLVFSPEITTAGSYKIYLRTRAANGNDDSFWVRANGEEWIKFNDIPLSGNWTWQRVHDSNQANEAVVYCLPAGVNTIEIAGRENGTQLDKILITGGNPPADAGGTAENCGEICDNGIDDDGNGLTDCDDPACFAGLTSNVVTSDNSLCAGDNTVLYTYGSGGTGPYSYTWSNGLGTGGSKTVSPTVNTTYTVTVTDDNGCTAVGSLTIDVVQTTAITPYTNVNGAGWVNQSVLGVCEGDDFSLGSQVGLQNGISLTLPDGTVDNTPNGNTFFDFTDAAPAAAGNYLMTYTDGNGCSVTQDFEVTVSDCTEVCGNGIDDDGNGLTDCEDPVCFNGLDVNINTSASVICSGETTVLTASASGGDGSYTYAWSNGQGSGSDKNVTPTATTTYTVTVTDGNGCTNTDDFTVTVNANPVLQPRVRIDNGTWLDQTTVSLCPGQSFDLGAQSSLSGSFVLTLPDNSTDNTPTAAAYFSFTGATVNSAGTYLLTYTDADGCQDTQTYTVTVASCPEICDNGYDDDLDGLTDCEDPDCTDAIIAEISSFPTSAAGFLCNDQTYTFAAAEAGSDMNYTWNFGIYAAPQNLTGKGPHDVTFDVPPGTLATHIDVQMTVTDTDGCSVTDTETVTVRPRPEILTADVTPNTNCNAANGEIQISAFVPEGEDFEVSLDGGSTWENINKTNFTDLSEGSYVLTVRYAGGGCVNDYGAVSVSAPVAPVVTPDVFAVGCSGFVFAENATHNDSNFGAVTLTVIDQPANGTVALQDNGDFTYTPGSPVCSDEIFTYRLCDDNTNCCASTTVTLQFSDDIAPELLNVPPADTVFCDEVIPQAPFVFAYENCQSINLGLEETNTQGDDGCSLHDYTLTRTWTATDACGNTGTASQTVEITDITAPDIFRIYTLPNGKKMVAGVIENVTHRWKTVQLPIDFATTPLIFNQVVTTNESSPVTVRTRNVVSSQFEIKLQEEQANDGIHKPESVAWTAIEEGMSAGDFSALTAQVGNTWVPVDYGQTFAQTPILLTTMQSTIDNDPAAVRMNGAGSASFDLFIQEEQSSESNSVHSDETTAIFAVGSAGNFTDENDETIGESGTVSVAHHWKTVDLAFTYHNPVVIANSLTYNGNQAAVVKVRNVTPTSFEVSVQEWDYLDGAHAQETVGWLVIEGSLPLINQANCNAVPPPLTIGTELIATDNCDSNVPLSFVETDNDADCATRHLVRSYTTVDECGNGTVLNHTIYIQDTAHPLFTAPADVTVLCDEDRNDLTLTGDVTDETDNCAENLQAVYTDNLVNLNGDDCATGYLTRTWSLTDDCGNSFVREQIITLYENADRDRDGSPDLYDLDRDNDGIPNADETEGDSDGDGIPNDRDSDSDNDGIPDAVEAGFIDLQGDGRVDNILLAGWDNDGDGFAEGFDADDSNADATASDNFDPTSLAQDRDQDGVPNFLDLDSDNDGIPDLIEVYGADTNGDGIPEYPTPGDASSMPDADADGYHDLYDSDDDGEDGQDDPNDPLIAFDGNIYSSGQSGNLLDTDGDGIPNYLDTDSDNDGICDLIEIGGIDTDGDGKIDFGTEFADNNQDGLHDNYSSFPLIYTDADGATIDGKPEDVNSDGSAYYLADVDYDNFPNYLDLDSDGDGIHDIAEVGGLAHDVNHDGKFDAFSDANGDGFSDAAQQLLLITTEPDGSDNHGRPTDGTDTDSSPYRTSHADGTMGDADSEVDVDADGDGIANPYDFDSDGDLIPDATEDTNADGMYQPGETHPYDRDTDNDLLSDGIEDANKDGIYTADETDPRASDTDGDTFDDGTEDADRNGFVNGNETDPRDPCDPILSTACLGVAVRPKVKLQGAMLQNGGDGTMRDDLRALGLLPLTEPYSEFANYVHVGGGGGETVDPAVFTVTGNNAIVDWVFVELRDSLLGGTVISTRSALLQKDGDVKDIDGVSDLFFADVQAQYYYVTVRHRNHLGMTTKLPLLLTRTPAEIDFTDVATPVYGENPARIIFGEYQMWAGDFNQDSRVIYQGPDNDLFPILIDVLTHPSNVNILYNYVVQGYYATDLDMDGKVIMQGPDNDPSNILFHGILSEPNNINLLDNYIILEKTPE